MEISKYFNNTMPTCSYLFCAKYIIDAIAITSKINLMFYKIRMVHLKKLNNPNKYN